MINMNTRNVAEMLADKYKNIDNSISIDIDYILVNLDFRCFYFSLK